MKKKITDSILISLLVTALTAGIAMLFVDTKSAWYVSLIKPSIQPPPIVFIIAWTVIYLLYAASLTLAQIKNVEPRAYAFYALQAVLNIAWCLFFFTLHMMYVGFAMIVLYLAATYLTVREIYGQTKTGALILLPQAAWLILAAVVNYMTILLN